MTRAQLRLCAELPSCRLGRDPGRRCGRRPEVNHGARFGAASPAARPRPRPRRWRHGGFVPRRRPPCAAHTAQVTIPPRSCASRTMPRHPGPRREGGAPRPGG